MEGLYEPQARNAGQKQGQGGREERAGGHRGKPAGKGSRGARCNADEAKEGEGTIKGRVGDARCSWTACSRECSEQRRPGPEETRIPPPRRAERGAR
jgi:hypothetical protein